jgi:hypothetical protein
MMMMMMMMMMTVMVMHRQTDRAASRICALHFIDQSSCVPAHDDG